MSAHNQFAQRMSSLSDQQLLQVMVDRKDYVPEALRAAEAEIARRAIPDPILDAALAEGERRKSIADERSDVPLSFTYQWLYFGLSFLACTPMVAFFYRYHAESGYDRRSQESLRMVFLGILFYLALAGTIYRIFGFEWLGF